MSPLLLFKTFLQALGMQGLGFSLLLGAGLERVVRGRGAWRAEPALRLLFLLAFGATGLIALAYLAYPNYIDHVEPTLANLGLMLQSGQALYPPFDAVSLHGLLYGPLLAQIQAVFQLLPLDPILSSKLPAVAAFLGFFAIAARSLSLTLARGYLLALVPFGYFLFWYRAEPFFLLLCALAWLACQRRGVASSALLGVLCALAFALKLHGVIYIAPFVLLRWRDAPPAGRSLVAHSLAFGVAAAATVLLCFGWDSVSVPQYLRYLQLASRHGLDGLMLERNLVYLACMALPLAVCLPWRTLPRADRLLVAATLSLEALAALAGAKPGAGVHHLLPFLFVNACLLQRHAALGPSPWRDRLHHGFLVLGLYALLVVLPSDLRHEAARNRIGEQAAARAQLQDIAARHPDAVMGYAGTDAWAYSLTFYRVLLQAQGSQQVDAGAFMDLAFSGLSDRPWAEVLLACQRKILVLPAAGEPFSLENYYTNQPLFSDAVRQAFRARYQRVEVGTYYDVYRCS